MNAFGKRFMIAGIIIVALLVGAAMAINPGSQVDPAQAVIISATPLPIMEITPIPPAPPAGWG